MDEAAAGWGQTEHGRMLKRQPWEGRRRGVLRDDTGQLLLAFSTSFGSCTSIQAEARALLFGVNLCLSHGYARVHVEVDSLVLVQILKQASRCPWGIHTEFRNLLQLSSYFISISHCFREGNQVADCLSSVGCNDGSDRVYYQFADLPARARGALRLDRIGLPSIRKC
nr:uncharacterized protein LOC113704512 [Coffea arabica]